MWLWAATTVVADVVADVVVVFILSKYTVRVSIFLLFTFKIFVKASEVLKNDFVRKEFLKNEHKISLFSLF